jgi:hypothetical protein
VVVGVASKGIISGGNVMIFALGSDGAKGALLGQGTTQTDGSYSVNIHGYTGPVTVEVSGDYTDEATGSVKTVPQSAPLRAALGSASGNVTLAVTPLTDLAVRQAGALTPQNIATANDRISGLFKVDIVATAPVAPTSAAFQSGQTTQSQKDYTLALAAISQLMQTSGSDLTTVLASLDSGITPAGMSSQAATTMTAAVTTFITNPQNQTGVTTISETSLQTVGSTPLKLTLALTDASALVQGVQTTITLPAGVELRALADGQPLNGVVALTGRAANGVLACKYVPATPDVPASLKLGLITSSSLGTGDILTINADLAKGASTPAASAFVISAGRFIDGNGDPATGASLGIR